MVIKGSVSDSASDPLGQRRGISDLAQIALDLAWVSESAEQDSFARYRAYPSPPMSGSPPLPSKQPQDAGDRGQAPVGYSASRQPDTYWGNSNQQLPTDHRGPANMQTTLPRLFQPGPPDAPPFSYRRTEETVPRPVSYIQPGGPSMSQSSGYIPPGIPGAPSSYTSSVRPPVVENQPMTSPKSQRKTKGHVASACVPCKRAHLRCDAQRPCSRCITNGKEESCVDVQHKKRGRPRLRDDRETRYDPSRFPHPQDTTARRPLSIYPSGVPIGPGEHTNTRYHERGPNMDAPTFAPSLSAGPRGVDPVAFLNMKMDFAKASPTFMEAVGHMELQGQNLGDVVVPAEREKVASIRSQLIEEQTRKEPNYLPPILSRLDHIIQGLGFGAEDIGRFQLDRNEYLTFRAADGQPRQYPVRLGLEKEGSIYVVVMVLSLPHRHAYLLPSSPAAREASHAYGSQPPTPQSLYRTPVPPGPPFDMPRGRFSEVPLVSRPAAVPPTQFPAAINPGIAAGAGSTSYAASPSHTEYGGPPSYNVPRSELPLASVYRPQAAFQLPPIRAQPGPEQPRPRTQEERSNRVDIGGLIDKPDDPERRR
ncbi:transcription activator of gluconeogenesis ERT1 [Fusarium subglutinans]|uniref:Transcription activator of gluconeogenesis ERT1 n=1 Tax=Gibberella subglutinans TaxID=42677 RepID=A0A8H5LDV8_GIBSU|nr:transcription activator of gluconeogenesis ERT1 [Fusarium subglutinans]KAF5588866.1 transcription activator of gluconeogenesis ERT1 [Fusarium subglutinans]